ncbi:MAG: UDP-N-acetylmuramate dehydrogenase [Firmicutes bacterium]|nr:UDP-N-acetylmuramate dehydrogenase [Bacillota bacterium]
MMDWNRLAEELGRKVRGRVFPRASMKEHTTWRVGGPADLLLIPQTEDDVIRALDCAGENALPVTVIGNGSNLLVRDGGIRGLTLKIARGLTTCRVKEDKIEAGAGVLLPHLARLALRAELSGLEFALGIPASLGGALVMNAGAFGQQLGDLVREVQTVDLRGARRVWDHMQLSFSYRRSSLLEQNLIVLRAVLSLNPARASLIAERMKQNLARRRETQPLGLPTAGCVFRNPPGRYAGQLIEMAGLKGLRVGDAQVSPKHANFIVNLGNATAGQILALMELIQEKVRSQFGVNLEPEVRMVGEEG